MVLKKADSVLQTNKLVHKKTISFLYDLFCYNKLTINKHIINKAIAVKASIIVCCLVVIVDITMPRATIIDIILA